MSSARTLIGRLSVCQYFSKNIIFIKPTTNIPCNNLISNQIRHSSHHLNDVEDIPIIKMPVYYKEGMQHLKGVIRNEELEELRRRERLGNEKVPIIRCKARKLAHFDGQTYDHHRLPLATYRWKKMTSAGQDFIIRAYAKNQQYKGVSDEGRFTYLSGHVEQRFVRVNRSEKPDLLLKTIEKLQKTKDQQGKPPLITVYCRKLATASYLETYLNKHKLSSKTMKGNLSRVAGQLLMQELLATNCNILLKLDSRDKDSHIDSRYQYQAESIGLEITHLINYDCPDTIRLYEERFEDVIQGDVLSGRRRTVTTFVRFKLEAEIAQKIERLVRLNT